MANEGNLRPFKPGYDERRNVSGRPKLLVNVARDYGYSADDVQRMIQVIHRKTVDEVKALMKDRETPILELICARAALRDLERGSLHNTVEMWNRAHGKAKETVDNNISGMLQMPVKITERSSGVPIARSEKDVQMD